MTFILSLIALFIFGVLVIALATYTQPDDNELAHNNDDYRRQL